MLVITEEIKPYYRVHAASEVVLQGIHVVQDLVLPRVRHEHGGRRDLRVALRLNILTVRSLRSKRDWLQYIFTHLTRRQPREPSAPAVLRDELLQERDRDPRLGECR